jgi:TfoX/Sxy family transcriptional regulator of competence genes
MASDQATVDFILEQASRGNDVRARKMFGEYGLYCDERFVGIVADDRLYLKVTEAGAALLPDAERESPYPGAKPHLVVDEEVIEDADRLSELMRTTAAALPAPKPKRSRSA